MTLASGDEVRHISTRKPSQRPSEILIPSAKRLLQQYLPTAEAEANRLRQQQSINRDRLPCVYFALVAFKLRIATVAERLVQNKRRRN